jgi:hypothetical protein
MLTWILWRGAFVLAIRNDWRAAARVACRVALVVFFLANAMFLVVDGLVVGLRAATDPVGVDAIWESPTVILLANVAGAAWCLALLSLAAVRVPADLDRATAFLLALTWLVFLVSATQLQAAQPLSRVAAIGTAAWLVFRGGAPALPCALLVLSAVLRQHVGPEAALGIVLVAAALVLPRAE